MLNWLWSALGYKITANAAQDSKQPTIVTQSVDNPPSDASLVPNDLQIYAMLADRAKRNNSDAINTAWMEIQTVLTQHTAYADTLVNQWKNESHAIANLIDEQPLSTEDEQAIQSIQTLAAGGQYFLQQVFLEFNTMIEKFNPASQDKFFLFFWQSPERGKNAQQLTACLTEILQGFQDTQAIRPGHYQLMMLNTSLQLLTSLQKQLLDLRDFLAAIKNKTLTLAEINKLKSLMQVPLQHITNELYQFHLSLQHTYQYTLPQKAMRKG